MRYPVLISVLPCLIATPIHAQDSAVPAIGPDELAFSIGNMDTSAAPGDDFYRYAARAWVDRVERPERLQSIGVFDFMNKHVKAQMECGRRSDRARPIDTRFLEPLKDWSVLNSPRSSQ